MGTTLYVKTYPKEIIVPKYFKYLDKGTENGTAVEFGAKLMPEGFFDACRRFGIEHDGMFCGEYFHCFVIPDVSILSFLASEDVPSGFGDIYVKMVTEGEDTLVIWCY